MQNPRCAECRELLRSEGHIQPDRDGLLCRACDAKAPGAETARRGLVEAVERQYATTTADSRPKTVKRRAGPAS